MFFQCVGESDIFKKLYLIENRIYYPKKTSLTRSLIFFFIRGANMLNTTWNIGPWL